MVEVRAPYGELEHDLADLPDQVADALAAWKRKEAELKHERARLYLSLKAKMAGTQPTQGDLRAMVDGDAGIYLKTLDCVTAESEYTRLMERLMSLKRLASMRAAF